MLGVSALSVYKWESGKSRPRRAQLQVDARTQTDYGTLRTYLSVNSTFADVVQTAALNRAFIQWAGFTMGRATSFSDTWNINESYHQGQINNADTAAAGVNVFAYTQELGNGMTITFGADDVRRKPLLTLANTAAIRAGTEPANSFRGVDLTVNAAADDDLAGSDMRLRIPFFADGEAALA